MSLYFSKEKFRKYASMHLKKILNDNHLEQMDGVEAEKEVIELRSGKLDTFYSIDYNLHGESFSAYPIDEKFLVRNKQETLF